MNIHENIRRLREEKGMTLEEVGKRTGTTKQTIKRYESGEISNIPYDRITALADCFNVTPGYLIGWEIEIENDARIDVHLTNMEKRLKEYALKLSRLSKDKQELVMQIIDTYEDKKGE